MTFDMSDQFVVIKPHITNYPNPISFSAGDVLEVGDKDKEYEGWIRVTTVCGNEGWAPEQYLDMQVGKTIALENYSAKELNTRVGEIVEHICSLNQWHWVENATGDSGWVPAHSVKVVSSTDKPSCAV